MTSGSVTLNRYKSMRKNRYQSQMGVGVNFVHWIFGLVTLHTPQSSTTI